MKDDRRDFDREAATWDDEPGRVKLAEEVARAIREEVRLSQDMDVLDFGCGTGLLTLLLQPLVRSVTGADNSPGMLDVLRAKTARMSLSNVMPLHLDTESGDVLTGSFHLIVSSMTFHHIQEIGHLLHQLHTVIIPGGRICVADLDPDGGKFHTDNKGVYHSGFDRSNLSDDLKRAGFNEVRDRTAATVTKPDAEGIRHTFSIFLMTARKRT